ncbi:MAG: hypothetical protein WKF57_11570 [Nakamurella sp.]
MTAPARPGFLGSDVEAQQRFDSSLTTAAQSFTSVRTRISKQLAGLEWYGTDGTTFRQLWDSSCAPALQRISEAMTTAAGAVSRQREQQENASRASGDVGVLDASSPVGAAVTPASTGGGGTTTQPSATPATPATPPSSTTGGPVALQVPFYSQLIAGNGFTPGNTACFKASKAMAAQLGAEVLGPDQRIQVAAGENSDGSVRPDAAQAAAGRSYLDQQLDSGKPVVVGVSHKGAYNGNVDGITDHFVIVTGRGTDADGGTYYTFNDPATAHASKGADTNVANRFHVGENGVLVSAGSVARGSVVDRHIEVSMVRRNR